MIDGRMDADGQPQFRIRCGVDASMTIGDRPMDNDLSYRFWEISVDAIAALRKELSTTTEQLIDEKLAAVMAGLPVGVDRETVQQMIEEKAAAFLKSEVTTPRGPMPRGDWYVVVIGEAYKFKNENGSCAGTGTLAELCEAKTGYYPEPDQIRRLFRRLFIEHWLGRDSEPASAGRVFRPRGQA